jgi:hypothetical protein
MPENLKIIIPQVAWGIFACISGWQAEQMLWVGANGQGAGHVLICLGLVALASNWYRVVYYFAPAPVVLRGGTLILLLLLGIVYFPFSKS